METDEDVNDSESEEEKPLQKKKPVIVLDVGDDGRPLLPDTVVDGSLGFDDVHPIVREYITVNYSSVLSICVLTVTTQTR